MTAEVAVLNKSAVALAADSAMSVGDTGKTYPTNKLFALTKYRPIGLMIYNNAEFMGIPWETIVKMYRHELGPLGKATVTDYAEDFLGYVVNKTICTDEQRHGNFRRIMADLLRRIARDTRKALNAPSANQECAVRNLVEQHAALLARAGEAPSMQNVDASALVAQHDIEINGAIDHYFSNYDIDDSVRQSLHDIVGSAIGSAQLSGGFSGLVFAGFGEDEIFPSLVEVVTDGVVGNVAKADVKKTIDLGRTGTQTAIVPFAQSEMVGRFMEGVDRDFLRYLEEYLEALLTSVSRELLESSAPEGQLTEGQLSVLENVVRAKLDYFRQATLTFRRKRFVDPILDIVKHLPKEELASMAEALVNLTSLKRRVSMEEETVGGPIDVAVVSKGDGFVWIKRKHYFDPPLNRDYFARQSLPHTIATGGNNGL